MLWKFDQQDNFTTPSVKSMLEKISKCELYIILTGQVITAYA